MNAPPIDDFAEACGVTGPLRLDLLEEGQESPTRRSFDRPFVLIGRHPDADMSLSHEEVAVRHSYLQVVGGRLARVDLHRRAEAEDEDVPLRSTWVDPHRSFRVGPFAVGLVADDEGGAYPGGSRPIDNRPSPLAREYVPEQALPGVSLEFRTPEGKGTWRMKPAMALLGRSPACGVKLRHPSVSAVHCSLVRTPAGLWVVDLLSREGVFVDGRRVRFTRLAEGDEFRVGPFAVRVRYEGAAGPPATVDGPGRRRSGLSAPVSLQPIASATAVPLGDEVSTQAVAPLVGQVLQMQEQMFGQFQQVMTVMAETFSAMHREHLDFVRNELDEIRRAGEAMRADRPAIAPPATGRAAAPQDDPRPTSTSEPNPRTQSGGEAAPAPHGAPDPLGGLPEDPLGSALAGPRLKDPTEINDFVLSRLAAYERERRSVWNKLARVLTALRASD